MTKTQASIATILLASFTSLWFAAVAMAAENVADRLNGSWQGIGTIKKGSNGNRERVRCRMSARYTAGASSISLRYICLGIDVKFETNGTLKYNAKKGTIAGRLVTVGIGGFAARGRARGNAINVRLSGKDKNTGKPVSATLTVNLKGKRAMHSALSAIDPKTGKRFRAFTATFRR